MSDVVGIVNSVVDNKETFRPWKHCGTKQRAPPKTHVCVIAYPNIDYLRDKREHGVKLQALSEDAQRGNEQELPLHWRSIDGNNGKRLQASSSDSRCTVSLRRSSFLIVCLHDDTRLLSQNFVFAYVHVWENCLQINRIKEQLLH